MESKEFHPTGMATEEESEASKDVRNGEMEELDLNPRENLITLEGKPEKLPYPKSIIFIISNETCERFNFYGMRTVLVLYLTEKLLYDDRTATVLFHAFTTLVYFTCIFGAILSDSFLGKFRTILYLSVVYAFGSSIIALGAIPTMSLPAVPATIVGLLLIGIGSGGIKPCVSAFGADQFKLPEQLGQMATYFSIFYFSINGGSLISTFLTPILREDVYCFEEKDCYPLAFGVPCVLMILSIVFFISGKPLYKIVPPSGNMVTKVTKCIRHAIVTRRREKERDPREHWLDYSERKYGKQLVADIKVLLRILVLFIPLPWFWALFDQQGSRWTIQATRMSGDLGFYEIKPDQMQVVNPFLVLFLIPVFDAVIYPIMATIGIRRPLQKLAIGGFLAAIAFLLSGIVELELEKTYPILPSEGRAQVRFINGLPCNFTAITTITSSTNFELEQFGIFEQKNIKLDGTNSLSDCIFSSKDSRCPEPIIGKISLLSDKATTIFVTGTEIKSADVYPEEPKKERTPMLRVLFSSHGETQSRKVEFFSPHNTQSAVHTGNSSSRELFSIDSGDYEVHIESKNYTTITLKDGSVSTLIVYETPNEDSKFQVHLVEITGPNSVNMLWLLPQYIVMTAGEVMFSVTGLEFSYAQAPLSMKSVLQACWLLTVSIGNVIVTIIASARFFESQANEFFLFVVLMTLDMLFFIFLARSYKSALPSDVDSEADDAIEKREIFSAQRVASFNSVPVEAKH